MSKHVIYMLIIAVYFTLTANWYILIGIIPVFWYMMLVSYIKDELLKHSVYTRSKLLETYNDTFFVIASRVSYLLGVIIPLGYIAYDVSSRFFGILG